MFVHWFRLSDSLDMLKNCSSFMRLQRVLVWYRRFINNAKNPLQSESGFLKNYELSQALLCIGKNLEGTFCRKSILNSRNTSIKF